MNPYVLCSTIIWGSYTLKIMEFLKKLYPLFDFFLHFWPTESDPSGWGFPNFKMWGRGSGWIEFEKWMVYPEDCWTNLQAAVETWVWPS